MKNTELIKVVATNFYIVALLPVLLSLFSISLLLVLFSSEEVND